MSERKVLTKYYPPDFDPSAIARTRGPKQAGPKVQTVRLMAPFSMKCISCGEFIYKGRKFNARKETTDERYFSIAIYRFYIRCTRCSGEITFKTDPKNMDYVCEGGAKRNFEVWRQKKDEKDEGDGDEGDDYLETEEERLERLVREEEERGAMANLETKVLDAKREMEIADALDEIRTRNARNERARAKGDGDVAAFVIVDKEEEERRERERIEREDDEAARKAFMTEDGAGVAGDDDFDNLSLVPGDGGGGGSASKTIAALDSAKMPPPITFKREVKKKKDFSAALGIKKKKVGLV
ncbi:hypothetical protein MMC31_003966 [Peltigera leucophlebia]|nr:hypothetical protein [Peltigera leucophlebia]